MTDRSTAPAKILPGTLLLRTEGARVEVEGDDGPLEGPAGTRSRTGAGWRS